MPLAVTLVTASLLAGCSSSPRVQFHSLMSTEFPTSAPAAMAAAGSGSFPVAAPRAAPFAFRIESPVRVPAQVNQPQLVLRTAQGGVRVQEYQRWVAPLSDEWRDAVAAALARASGAQDASRMPAAPGLNRWDLRLELQRFDAVPGQQVLQQVAWSVQHPQRPGALLSCSTSVTRPAPSDVPGIVAAHREATHLLAGHLAHALRTLQSGAAATCPATDSTPPSGASS